MKKIEGAIIGSGLDAKLLSAKTGFPVFYRKVNRPRPFSYYSADEPQPLSPLFDDEKRVLERKNGSNMEVGAQKMIAWDLVSFLISLEGQDYLSGKKTIVSYEDSKLHISTESGVRDEFEITDTLYVVEPEQVRKSDISILKEEKKSRVIDWMRVHKNNPNFHYWERDDDFPKEVWVFDHESGQKNKKSILSVSHLTEDELQHPEYTKRFSRLILERGMGGEFELESFEREIDDMNVYDCKETEKVEHVDSKVICDIDDLTIPIKKRVNYMLSCDRNLPTGHIT